MDEAKEPAIARAHREGRVEPVGHVLRSTYGTDNHETLSNDIAGLMIDLSRVPFDETDVLPTRPPPFVALSAAPPAPERERVSERGWFGRVADLLRLR